MSTALGGGTTIAQGVVIEMILTAQLVFTIFMLAAEKHTGNFIAPVGIGLNLFVAELTGQSHDFSLHPYFACLLSEVEVKGSKMEWADQMLRADNMQEYSGQEAL